MKRIMDEQYGGAPQMRTLDIEIFNTHLTVWAGEDAAYLQALATEVDARIQQIYATSAQISPLRAAIMAAYMYADEAKQQQGKERGEASPQLVLSSRCRLARACGAPGHASATTT
jgi:cell division protein ZapA (FtsZ GTPase activity inhibitor)